MVRIRMRDGRMRLAAISVLVAASGLLRPALAEKLGLEPFIASPYEQQTIQIFGLPLGGKFVQKLKQCSKNEEIEVKELCQRGKPSRMFSNGRTINVSLPDRSLPSWAYSNIELLVTSDGVLTRIVASSFDAMSAELAKSISLRFGQPDVDVSDRMTTWKTWLTKDVAIQASGFHGNCCKVEFIARSVYDEQIRRAAKARAERPLTP